MSKWSAKIKNRFGNLKKRVDDAQIKADYTLWGNEYARIISPDRIDIFDNHIKIRDTLVETLIVGVPQMSTDGYPRKMKNDFIDRLMNVALEGCTISVSFSVVPIPTHEAQELLQSAIFHNEINQRSAQENNPMNQVPIVLQLDARDIAGNIEQLHENTEKMFHSAFIITIWADSPKSMRQAKSHVEVVLNSNRILAEYPHYRMMETFLAAQPYPITEEFTYVEMFSQLAALVCPTRNPNSRISDSEGTGLYFGDDRKTGKEIIVNLDSLSAKHMVLVGATGSGKTFSTLMLLMRLYISGRRIIYLTVKPDISTHYRAVAEYFGDDAAVIDIGMQGRNINPLQIMFDSEAMGTDTYAYMRAYDNHKMLLTKFFQVWFGNAFSPNMESYLDKSLNRVYRRAGILRNDPDSWKNPFPVLSDLRRIWEEDSELHKEEDGESALALLRKTYQVGDEGALNYINKPTNIDLSANFIVIDLAAVPEVIQNAMNVLVTGLMASRFRTDNKKGTTIAVDEGGAFLRNPQLATMTLNTLTQGRSFDINMIFATQQFADIQKAKLAEEFMTNVPIKIVLGAGMDKSAVGYVKDFLKLDDAAIKDLQMSQVGEGIIKIGDVHAPIGFVPSEEETKIIKGHYSKNVKNTDEKTVSVPVSDCRIKPEYEDISRENRTVIQDWIEGEDPAYFLKMLGYSMYQVQAATGRGKVNCWIHEGIIKDSGNVRNQTLDHYATVIQIAGALIERGFENVKVNHFDDVDVSGEFRGRTYAFEYEKAGSHTKEELLEKKQRAISIYENVVFVGSTSNEQFLIDSVGAGFVRRRGQQLTKYLDECINMGEACVLPDLTTENQVKEAI